MRLGALVGIGFLVAGAVVNIATAPDRLPERLAGFALQLVICLGGLGIIHWAPARRRARTTAATYVLAMGSSLFYTLSLSPADLDVLTAPITCVTVGSALLFPWGAGPQALVSGGMVLGYSVFLWPHLPSSGMRAANVALSLGMSSVLSVAGALVLELSRRDAFAERRRVRALAVQRHRLMEVARDLWRTLSVDAIAGRLVEQARRLVAADGVALTLLDPTTRLYRLVAASGDPVLQTFMELPWKPGYSGRVCAGFATAAVRECPGSPIDDAFMPVLGELGFTRLLMAVVGTHPAPVGFLAFVRRTPAPFTPAERLTAQALAHQAFASLSAARLYEEATHADRLKSEFVSTMSHELRTPLHVILGYTEMLEDAEGTDRARTIDRIRAASAELLALIESTLDLNRLQSGGDAPRFAPVSLRALWAELESEFAALPRRPEVALRWEPIGEATLETDRRKLKIVLKNLIGNALKYTAAGEVVVTCRTAGGTCEFAVRDTGIGIAAEDLPYIFEMFRQVDSSDSRSYGGVGLGLYIVRRLLDALSGTVDVESKPGHGSTFTVRLPLRQPADGRVDAAA